MPILQIETLRLKRSCPKLSSKETVERGYSRSSDYNSSVPSTKILLSLFEGREGEIKDPPNREGTLRL